MKFITSIIKKIIPKDLPTPVGRWRIENCNKQMNHKIDLSNEDHCGPCGQYALDKIQSTKDKNQEYPPATLKYTRKTLHLLSTP
jgi:hypothetical protein